jgi:hypothetical protein
VGSTPEESATYYCPDWYFVRTVLPMIAVSLVGTESVGSAWMKVVAMWATFAYSSFSTSLIQIPGPTPWGLLATVAVSFG